MKKILVIGSMGMAGHMIRQVLVESNSFNIIDISRSGDLESSYSLDLSDLNELGKILEIEKPDVTINCAGILNAAAEANPEKSVFINSFIPHFLASRCDRLIQISTDCVFSGSKGNYTEYDQKDGQGFYAESKALGEVLYGPHLTLRTSIIGPELKSNGTGLLHWFLNQRGHVKGHSKALWSGVTTLQLAKVVAELIDNAELTGLVHYTNGTKISKLDFLKLTASVFHKEIEIIPYDHYHVDKSLVNTRSDISLKIPDYETMIKDLYSFMDKHKTSIYQQYYS